MNYRESDVEALLRGASFRTAGPVPANVSSRVEAVLEGLPERRQPRSRSRLRPLAAAGAIGLAIVVVASIAERGGFVGEARSPSASMRVVGQVMPEADHMMGPSVTDQGITVMVREVVYDNYALGLRYTVSSDRPIGSFKADAELQLDGQWIGYIGSIPEGVHDKRPLDNRYQRTEDGTYEGAIIAPVSSSWRSQVPSYRMGDAPVLDANSVQFRITQIGGIAGNWFFDIPIQAEPGRTVSGRFSRTNANGTFHLDQVVASPVSMQVTMGFTLGDIGKSEKVGAEIADDTGHIYGDETLGSYPSNLYLSTTVYLPPLSAEAKSLIIRPYVFDQGTADSVPELFRTTMTVQPTESKPLKLPIGDAGTLEVTGIEYLPDRTIVHTQPDLYARGFMLLDDQGRSVDLLSWDSGDGAQFEPVSPDAKLVFVTSAEPKRTYLPELEIKVDLPPAK